MDKWAANNSEILPLCARQNEAMSPKKIDRDHAVKTLGVQWDPIHDQFHFNALQLENISKSPTKRSVLSNIARLFDPLGWLSPVTVTAKIMMQDLWIIKCDWDSPLPEDARERWTKYNNSLLDLPTLSISRARLALDSL